MITAYLKLNDPTWELCLCKLIVAVTKQFSDDIFGFTLYFCLQRGSGIRAHSRYTLSSEDDAVIETSSILYLNVVLGFCFAV